MVCVFHSILGYQADDTANKFKKYVVDGPKGDESNPVDGLTDQMAGLSRVRIAVFCPRFFV